MGTAEFYRVVESLPQVADSLVIDTSTASNEGDLLLFVVLIPDAEPEPAAQQLRSLIRQKLTPRHVPGRIIPVPSLPRTLNGKKCEVPIKRILTGTPQNKRSPGMHLPIPPHSINSSAQRYLHRQRCHSRWNPRLTLENNEFRSEPCQ
jgi:hypothetical protein